MLSIFTLGLEGAVSGDEFGAALLGAHDFVDDDAADLVIGAPGANQVFLYAVSAEGDLDEAGVLTLEATSGASDFGRTLATLTDGAWGTVLVVGAPGSGGVYLRARSDSFASDAISLAGTTGDEFGAALTAGDFNGDGFEDLAVGAPLSAYSGVAGGSVYVFDGGPSGLAETASLVLSGASAGDAYGTALAAGDFDGDGLSDLAVGAPRECGDCGAVYVYMGSPSGLPSTADWTETGASWHALGTSLAVGDTDGDGYDDLYITAEVYDVPAMAWGSAAGLAASISSPNAYWGFSVVGPAADADGDGLDDVPWFYWFQHDGAYSACEWWRMASGHWSDDFPAPGLVALAPGGDHVPGVGAWLWAGESKDAGRVWQVLVDTDADDDGYGANLTGDWADCDDADFDVKPVAVDIPGDGLDQDCTGADASWSEDAGDCVSLATFAEARSWIAVPLIERSPVGSILDGARAEAEALDAGTLVDGMADDDSHDLAIWRLEDSLIGSISEREVATRDTYYDHYGDCAYTTERTTDERFSLQWDSPGALGVTALRAQRLGTEEGWESGSQQWYDATGVAWRSPETAARFEQHYWSRRYSLRSFIDEYTEYNDELSETFGSCFLEYAYDYDRDIDEIETASWSFLTPGGQLEVIAGGDSCALPPDQVAGSQDGGPWLPLHASTWGPVVGTDADGDGWPIEAGDCDDNHAQVHPCADKVNNCQDNDCDGEVDEFDSDGDRIDDCEDCEPADARYDVPVWWYGPDDDGDGYGVSPVAEACTPPEGTVALDGDCDDSSASVHPGAEDEPGDGIDADCDGSDPPSPEVVPEEEAEAEPPPEKRKYKKDPGLACASARGDLLLWLVGPLLLARRRRPRAAVRGSER